MDFDYISGERKSFMQFCSQIIIYIDRRKHVLSVQVSPTFPQTSQSLVNKKNGLCVFYGNRGICVFVCDK